MTLSQPAQINVLIYHRNCTDGFGAAFAAWTLLGNRCEYIAATHGDSPPDVKGKHVAICDFSYNYDITLKLIADAKSLIVIDHHKTAEADLVHIPIHNKIFDMTHSGAYLAWKFFHPDVPVPRLIQYIEDKDIWKWSLPLSKEFSAALMDVPFSFEAYNELMKDDKIDSLIEGGKHRLAFQDMLIKRIASKAFVRKLVLPVAATPNPIMYLAPITDNYVPSTPPASISLSSTVQRDKVAEVSTVAEVSAASSSVSSKADLSSTKASVPSSSSSSSSSPVPVSAPASKTSNNKPSQPSKSDSAPKPMSWASIAKKSGPPAPLSAVVTPSSSSTPNSVADLKSSTTETSPSERSEKSVSVVSTHTENSTPVEDTESALRALVKQAGSLSTQLLQMLAKEHGVSIVTPAPAASSSATSITSSTSSAQTSLLSPLTASSSSISSTNNQYHYVYTVMVVNASVMQSEIGNALADDPTLSDSFSRTLQRNPATRRPDFVLVYYYDGADKANRISLRASTSSDIDLSLIAKFYKGGGHPKACGCVFPGQSIDAMFTYP